MTQSARLLLPETATFDAKLKRFAESHGHRCEFAPQGGVFLYSDVRTAQGAWLVEKTHHTTAQSLRDTLGY